jgi:hypothetical protein
MFHKITFGPTFTTDRARGYTHHLIVELASREDLPKYATHASHVHVVKTILANVFELSEVLALDVEN